MIAASRLAGFFAAHAIWSVSDNDTSEPMVPMLAYTCGDDVRNMIRFAGDDVAECVQSGRDKLEVNSMDAQVAALVYDGRITIDERQLDAIVIEVRTYQAPDSRVIIAVPYTPLTSGHFLVHRPKLLQWEQCEAFGIDDVLGSFFEGVDEHDEGSRVWSEHLDESL